MSTEGHFCQECGCDEGPHGCICGNCEPLERDDHAAAAVELLMGARDANTPEKSIAFATAAQAAATLALVEQQRVANLIALRQADSDVLRDIEWDYVDAVIREGLGLS